MSAVTRCLLVAAAAVSLASAAADAAVADSDATLAPAGLPAPGKYVTRLHQGSNKLNENGGTVVIPDGQCSGVVDDALKCKAYWRAPKGVKVVARDHAPYPNITISPDLKHATVTRALPCSGAAYVDVELACSTYAPTP